MPQEELDLLQLASRSMAEPSTGPSQIVWRQLRHADALGGFPHNVPNRLHRHAISPCPSNFVDPAEQFSSIDSSCGEPIVEFGSHRLLEQPLRISWQTVQDLYPSRKRRQVETEKPFLKTSLLLPAGRRLHLVLNFHDLPPCRSSKGSLPVGESKANLPLRGLWKDCPSSGKERRY